MDYNRHFLCVTIRRWSLAIEGYSWDTSAVRPRVYYYRYSFHFHQYLPDFENGSLTLSFFHNKFVIVCWYQVIISLHSDDCACKLRHHRKRPLDIYRLYDGIWVPSYILPHPLILWYASLEIFSCYLRFLRDLPHYIRPVVMIRALTFFSIYGLIIDSIMWVKNWYLVGLRFL